MDNADTWKQNWLLQNKPQGGYLKLLKKATKIYKFLPIYGEIIQGQNPSVGI